MTKQGSGQGLIAEREGGGLRLLLWPGLQVMGSWLESLPAKLFLPPMGLADLVPVLSEKMQGQKG